MKKLKSPLTKKEWLTIIKKLQEKNNSEIKGVLVPKSIYKKIIKEKRSLLNT